MNPNLAVAVLVLGLILVITGLVERAIGDRVASDRHRRQAETQQRLNAASARMLRQVDQLDAIIEDLKRHQSG